MSCEVCSLWYQKATTKYKKAVSWVGKRSAKLYFFCIKKCKKKEKRSAKLYIENYFVDNYSCIQQRRRKRTVFETGASRKYPPLGRSTEVECIVPVSNGNSEANQIENATFNYFCLKLHYLANSRITILFTASRKPTITPNLLKKGLEVGFKPTFMPISQTMINGLLYRIFCTQ